jgi:hypothetical protein
MNLMAYGPVIRGKRKVYHAASMLAAYQVAVRAAREGERIECWTWYTEAGRKMLGLARGEFYVPSIPRPKGLIICPSGPCEKCKWSGETTPRGSR